MSPLPIVVAVPLALLMVCSVTWIAAETMRRMHARGTRGRYVWASVERPTRYPAMAYLLVSAVLNARVYDDWFMFALNCMGVGLQIALIQDKKKNGEDDDFWKSFGEKLSAFLSPRTPATASGTGLRMVPSEVHHLRIRNRP